MSTATPSRFLSTELHSTTPAGRFLHYVRQDFMRNLRLVENTVFVIVLPIALYLMFGAFTEYGAISAGDGNLRAYAMTGMALYGAVIAMTALTGSGAIERHQGWSRQLSLTALTSHQYIAARVIVSCLMASLPIIGVFVAGVATGAEFSSLWVWCATAILLLTTSVTFALYGLGVALVFRSEAATVASSGMLVVFAFLGNLFVPLSGLMQKIGEWTPLYGIGVIARWPQMQGQRLSQQGIDPGSDSLTVALINVAAWTAVFTVVCLLGARSRNARA